VTRRGSLAAAGAALAAAPAGTAAPVTLPSPLAPVRTTPPLRAPGPPAPTVERRFPRTVSAAQRVSVRLRPGGEPERIVAVDVLTVEGTGDYAFAIPAPVIDVTRGPRSASEPGLRRGAVLWQGFSNRRRLLVANVVLDPAHTAASLPIGIEIRAGELRIVNRAAASASAPAGRAAPGPVARALDAVRAALRARTPIPTPTLAASTADVERVRVRISIRVAGSLSLEGGRTIPISTRVRDRPAVYRFRGSPRALELRATPEDPLAPLRPPRGATWRAHAAHTRFSEALAVASRRLLESALALQYQSFLANPDPAGVSRTSYRFVLAPRAAASAASPGGAGAPWLAIGFAIAFGVALATGLVAWAHS
jgi:hypothetical protein